MRGLKKINEIKTGQEGTGITALSEALSFRISRLAAINERNGSQYFRSQFDLSLCEWRVLGLVAQGDPATTRSARATLLMDRGLLSRVVKGLTKRKLITSKTAPDDKRQSLLFLTPQGWDLYERCIAFTKERNAVMTSVLTCAERTEFERLLDLLIYHNAELLKNKGLSDD